MTTFTMSTTRYDDDQPGLEVVGDREGLELATDRGGQYPEVARQTPNKYFENDRTAAPQSYSAPSYRKPAPLTYSEQLKREQQIGESYRKVWLVLAIVIAILVVVGAIVGGVVGSREMRKSKDNNSSSSAASSPKPPPASTSPSIAQQIIRANSPLTATGWREGAFFHIWLFYQGPDGVVRRSRYSSEGSKGWSKPENLTAIKTLSTGTPLAATTNLEKKPPQVNLYYLDELSRLKGFSFQESSSPPYSSSSQITSLNNFPTTVSASSKITAYWPVLATQNRDGTIQYFRDWSFEGRAWENYTLPNSGDASAGTPLVMLPTAVTYLDAAGLLYVNNKGMLSTYLSSTNNTVVDGWAWSNGSTGITFPNSNRSSSVGAFAYGRTKNLINTYALFQGDDNKLYEAHQDGSGDGGAGGGSWKGPTTNEVLGGSGAVASADEGTSIACVTMALWELSEVRLGGSADMNRCFFQSDGGNKIKEVWFDGKKWSVVGDVPLA